MPEVVLAGKVQRPMRALLPALLAAIVSGCAPSDPATPSLGLTREGSVLRVWVEPCGNEPLATAKVFAREEANRADAVPIWAAQFEQGTVNQLNGPLAPNNPSLAQISGDYLGVKEVLVSLETAEGQEYIADATTVELQTSKIYWRGAYLTISDWRAEARAQCSQSA